MIFDNIPAGKNIPEDINVVIEIPANSSPVKYEIDKEMGAVVVDRFMSTPMFYPANYGFIPHTLSDDGDPADVLVVGRRPIVPGAVMPVRPIGVLLMEDEAGMDEKILAVPASSLHPFYDNVEEYSDLPQNLLDQIAHFFEHYKDLEKDKWVKIIGWKGKKEAQEIINKSIEMENAA